MKECRYYTKIEEGKDGGKSLKVRCELCPHRCVIPDGKHGICGSRWNFKGKLYSIVYGKPCALADDPVEKKPLNEFHACPFHVRGVTFGVLTVRTMTFRKHCPLM